MEIIKAQARVFCFMGVVVLARPVAEHTLKNEIIALVLLTLGGIVGWIKTD